MGKSPPFMKVNGYIVPGRSRAVYRKGEKYCRYCGIVVRGSVVRCPICGHNLRCKPRKSKYRGEPPRVDPDGLEV